MAKVILRNAWFAPNGRRYRKSPTKSGPPVDVPDELVRHLPSSAMVVPDDYVTPELGAAKDDDTFSAFQRLCEEHDLERAAGIAEAQARQQAEANQQAQERAKVQKREKFQKQLKAEAEEKTDAGPDEEEKKT